MVNSAPREIRCVPQGICSWNYWLIAEGSAANPEKFSLFHHHFSGGYITQGNIQLDIHQRGILQGRWELCHGETELITATSDSLFSRSMTLEDDRHQWELVPGSTFSNSYRLQRDGLVYATFAAEHAFTRRARIVTTQPDVDLVLLAFSFWLIAKRWRNQSQSG